MDNGPRDEINLCDLGGDDHSFTGDPEYCSPLVTEKPETKPRASVFPGLTAADGRAKILP